MRLTWRTLLVVGFVVSVTACTETQVHSGISVSHDSQWVAYIGPAGDGFFQVFRVPIAGGAPEQLTFDPTAKTQPAYSPDGEWIAFTAFHYSVQFWTTREDTLSTRSVDYTGSDGRSEGGEAARYRAATSVCRDMLNRRAASGNNVTAY